MQKLNNKINKSLLNNNRVGCGLVFSKVESGQNEKIFNYIQFSV